MQTAIFFRKVDVNYLNLTIERDNNVTTVYF